MILSTISIFHTEICKCVCFLDAGTELTVHPAGDESYLPVSVDTADKIVLYYHLLLCPFEQLLFPGLTGTVEFSIPTHSGSSKYC